MLEVVRVANEGRLGEAKLDYASAYQGYIAYIKGVDTDGTVLLSCPNSSAQSAKSYYPIKKYRMEEDLSDTSDAVDKIAKGARVVYYEGGEFWTDRFMRLSFPTLGFGAIPAVTAEPRTMLDVVKHTVMPTQAAYVVYWGDARGRLTCTAVGSSIAKYGGALPNPTRFRILEAYIASAASQTYGPAVKVRFQVVPGYVGQNF